MSRRCKPIIWCCVKKGTECEIIEQVRYYNELLNIFIKLICFKELESDTKITKTILKQPEFSKESDTVAIICTAGESETHSMSRPEFIKVFSSVSQLYQWLTQKYNSTQNECL